MKTVIFNLIKLTSSTILDFFTIPKSSFVLTETEKRCKQRWEKNKSHISSYEITIRRHDFKRKVWHKTIVDKWEMEWEDKQINMMVPAQKIIMIRVFVKHLHLKLLTRNFMNDDLTHTHACNTKHAIITARTVMTTRDVSQTDGQIINNIFKPGSTLLREDV